ncbi:glycosyl hydrolase [Haloferax sp. Atlit-19N]|uniref:PVC-type heme-binding CxxCH protein n=1 Tax=Haloferax TaxID=2251 RepID=UPI000679586A|nr:MULTISPECIES: PVC-type heme-binding CxxCH protein [Haloferax]RDZ40143.1 glycosyl hydrolase [Haloferax sp. Atlit-19N]
MTHDDDTTRESNPDDGDSEGLNINRRNFMKVSGVGAANFLGASGVAQAKQLTTDDTIRLVATEGDILAAYTNEESVIEGSGLADAISDWRQGDLTTNSLLKGINSWRNGTEIETSADSFSWVATAPSEMEDTTNPTLVMHEGEEYEIELSNAMDEDITFMLADPTGEVMESFSTMQGSGDSQTVSFTAESSMAMYYAEEHPEEMRGSVEITPPPAEDNISVLMMGGPQGGSHNAPARQVQLTEYMLDRGIEVQYTDRLADLEPDVLHRYDAWIMMDNRGANYGQELTPEQEQSIVEFVENGGGFIPIHSASACFTGSDAYMNLVGGQFAAHNFGEMTTSFAQPSHPILSTLDPITVEDETYRHMNLNDDINVLAYAQFPDGDSIPEYDDGREQGEPWSWTRTQGDGRIFYTAWGHGRAPWATDGFKALIENAIRWVTKNEDTIAEDTKVLNDLEFIDADIPYYPPPEGSLLAPEVPEEVGSGTSWNKMQRALNPSETVRRTITPEGFDLKPFVTEGDLPDDAKGNILDAKFDAQGRVWLSVTRDYPNELGQDRDKIVVCEDTDGDGQADEFTIFADGLSVPVSMVVVEDGVVVADLDDPSESGKMVHLVDTDGDGQADERNVLFSGFGNGDTHAGPNELAHGIDNWIWGQVGYGGFSGNIAGEERNFSSSVYRFKLEDGSVTDFEIVGALPGNQAGLGFTEEGLAFGSAATSGRPSNYFAIPHQYYDLIEGTGPNDFGAASDSNRFLPVTDRVRQVDLHGGYTAATGHTIYTAREYPQKYWNNTGFVGDGTGHILGSFFLSQDGAGYNTHYAHNIAGGTDAWFAPSYSSVGPDGMLWFIDWYNYIYQHNPTPGGFENGPGNAYMTEVRDHATARLFRVVYGDDDGYEPTDLADASVSELVDTLSSTNMFWRRTAQRLLVERNETGALSSLVDLVTTETLDEINLDPAAIHALWTMHGLGALDADTGNSTAIQAALGALTHSSPGVRLTALRVLPSTTDTRQAILDNDLLNDEDGRVAMWALVALAQTPSDDASGEAVYEMISAESNYQDTVLVDAASLAGATHADGFIPAYEANEDTSDGGDDTGDLPNLLENPSFETPAGGDTGGDSDPMPAGWSTTPYTGSPEFAYAETGYEGDRSVQVSSTEGADASWNTTVAVDPNTEYTLSAYVKTDSVQLVDGTSIGEGPLGATISVEQIANTDSGTQWDTIPSGLTGTNDWTEVSITINSGDLEELQINCLFGGYGEATGTAWFDSVSLTDPDGTDVLSNGSFEESTGSSEPAMPADWTTNTFAGTAEYTYADAGQDGSQSVQISSAEGADAVWLTDGISVQPETEYTLSGWIKTENVQVSDSARGALFNVHSTDFETGPLTGTNDWTEVSTTFTTGADTTTVQINCLFGGYGNATGTAWFDNVSLTDPDGNNVLPNASFEEAASTDSSSDPEGPANWEGTTYGGTAEFTYTSDVARTGDYSVRVDSTEGADASWTQFRDDLEPNSEYRFRAWVKTSDDFSNSEDGFGEIGSSYGVTINIHSLGQGSVTDYYTDPVEDWQLLETTFSTGASPGEFQFNLLFGGWGNATGTAWFDDTELKRIGGSGNGLELVYDRVTEHVEATSGDGSDDGGSDDGGSDVIPSGSTIELEAESNEGWTGVSPSGIADATNPTLTLEAGGEYTVTWTNRNGAPHNFEVVNGDDTVVNDISTSYLATQGESQSVTFTVTDSMAEYVCRAHSFRMRGTIEIASSGGN